MNDGKRLIGSCSGTNWSPDWWIRFGEPRMATLCWATSALPGRSRRSLAAGQCREDRDGRASVLNRRQKPCWMGDREGCGLPLVFRTGGNRDELAPHKETPRRHRRTGRAPDVMSCPMPGEPGLPPGVNAGVCGPSARQRSGRARRPSVRRSQPSCPCLPP